MYNYTFDVLKKKDKLSFDERKEMNKLEKVEYTEYFSVPFECMNDVSLVFKEITKLGDKTREIEAKISSADSKIGKSL